MLTFIDTITGILAPHECLACGQEGALLCPDCITLLPEMPPRCYRCGSTKLGAKTCMPCRKYTALESVTVVTLYEGFAEALLKRLKFERALHAAKTIAATYNLPKVADDGNVALVPIPTATSRVRRRGYDQSVQIAAELSKRSGMPIVTGLERIGQQRQTGSSRKVRKTQLEGAFVAKRRKLNGINSVILVDDVLTTGATLEAAARELKRTGIKHVSAAVFARAE